jgi:formate dehydrogenase maturation protein FdhE
MYNTSDSREASHALIEYFTASSTIFNPACSIFKNKGNRIVELGSGQSVASLHLAAQLDREDTLVLTDLPNVVPLMQQSIGTWRESRGNETCLPVAEPLGWGSSIDHLGKYGQLTHIICCDLVSDSWTH